MKYIYPQVPAKITLFFAMLYYCQKSHFPILPNHQQADLPCCWDTLMTTFSTEGASMLLAYLIYNREKTKKID
jgi:hypothetical protein